MKENFSKIFNVVKAPWFIKTKINLSESGKKIREMVKGFSFFKMDQFIRRSGIMTKSLFFKMRIFSDNF